MQTNCILLAPQKGLTKLSLDTVPEPSEGFLGQKYSNASKVWAVFYLVSIVVYIAFSMHMPLSVYVSAGHDDGLFLKNAFHILMGDWLGVYNQMTLAKGPAYSIFLAANAVLGIPVTLSIASLYAFACVVFIRVLARGRPQGILFLGLFLILLFQPALFPTRVLRENIYQSFTLLVIAGVIFIGRQQQKQYLKALLFGLVLGAFWITREEGVWILPGIALYLGFVILVRWKSRSGLRLLLAHLGLFFLAAGFVPLAVSTLNYLKYDSFEVVDFKNPSFVRVLNRLNSVSISSELPFVPVPHAKRDLIYQVSPAFAELEDYFENKGQSWKQAGCEINPKTCGDYTGGFFMWALRDAVAEKGYYGSPEQANVFYDRVSTEIDAACQTSRLSCTSRTLPFLPVIPPESLNRIPAAFKAAIQFSTYRFGAPIMDGASTGPLGTLNNVRIFLGNPKTMPSADEEMVLIAGWYYAPNQDWIELECQNQSQALTTAIARKDSPDIAQYFKDQNAVHQRFSLRLRKSDVCLFKVKNQRSATISVADALQLKSASTELGAGTLFFDERTAAESSYHRQFKLKQALGTLYLQVAPAIVSVGAACFILCIFLALVRRNHPGELFWLVGMLWVIYLTRVILVILVDISSFPAVGYLYLGASYPILYAASILSAQLLLVSGKSVAS